MVDINLIKEDVENAKKKVADKGYEPNIITDAISAYEKRNQLLQRIESKRAERNIAAKEKNIKEGKKIKDELKKLEPLLKEAESKYQNAVNMIPNFAFDDVPVGRGEENNVEIRKVGKIADIDIPKDHLELANALDIIDFERGAKVSGSQFYFLKNDAVMLEFALIQFGLQKLREKGYMLMSTPDLAKSRYYLGTGYLPKGDEAQIYEIDGEDLGLIATSEVTMAGYHADEVLNLKNPLKYAAISRAFRKEAGAYGKYSKGLYRVHQFVKLEMFIYCAQEDSRKMHEELLAIEEEITSDLEIPYRVLEMCTGDLGAIAAKKYDLEAWMPGRGDYGEITSTSNTTDYQSRNLNIKYRDKDKNKYAHMLNGTAIAVSRILISILENNQQKDGSITIPEVLQKWMGKDVIKK